MEESAGRGGAGLRNELLQKAQNTTGAEVASLQSRTRGSQSGRQLGAWITGQRASSNGRTGLWAREGGSIKSETGVEGSETNETVSTAATAADAQWRVAAAAEPEPAMGGAGNGHARSE